MKQLAPPLTFQLITFLIVISAATAPRNASVGFAPTSTTYAANAAKYGYDTPAAPAAPAAAAVAVSGRHYTRSATAPRPQPLPRRPSRAEAINHFVSRPTSTTFAADYRKR